ncbi:MAG: hypothetical protein ACOY16_04900 [Chloroflexota bacterium]
MKGKWTIMGSILVMLLLSLAVGLAWAQEPTPFQPSPSEGEGMVDVQATLGTAFTYQGQLKKNGSPVNDNCDFQFSLWDAVTGGTQIGSPQTKTGVSVSNGLFTVQLDFGAGAFQGDARWMEVAVKCAGDASYTTLTPRQPLTPAPYALALPGLWTQQNAYSPNLIGGYSGNNVNSSVVGATISGGGASGIINHVTSSYGTVGGGSGNTASGEGATVGGGGNNTASGLNATVGGGGGNVASKVNATVGGGYGNNANGDDATISGGHENTASNTYATVSGGYGNTASGQAATIPGGRENTALGACSFAAGQRAKAIHNGAFIWADSTKADFTSTADNQFAVRATGGVSFTTGSNNDFMVNGNKVWNEGNDGSGTGLDADTVDGHHATDFASASLLGSSWVYEANSTQDTLFSMSTTGWVVQDDGDGDHDHTLIITTTSTILVEYTLWYGSTVVHGEASLGYPATITFPHYQGFQLILARRSYIASLVCNENDGHVACVYQKSHP